MPRCLFCILVLCLGCMGNLPPGEPPADDLGTVDSFALTERSGKTIHRDDLSGKFWIASFIFTRCSGPCPQVSGTMARLQKELVGQPDVMLVTFSVDPEHDKPEVLREYAKNFGADPERWLFLTGPQDDLYHLIIDSFHLGVQQAKGSARVPGREVTHSTSLMLVDRKGHIRGKFDGVSVAVTGQPVDDVPRLVERIKQLRGEQP
jgi:cytochrome oxidase Cu insertion factor (SCO1/SenC/PrrC family)